MKKKELNQLKNKIKKIEKENQDLEKYLDSDGKFFLTVIDNAEELTRDIDKRIESIQLISNQLEDYIVTGEWKMNLITSQFDPFQSYARLQEIINNLQTLKQRIAEHLVSTYKKIEEIKLKKEVIGEEDDYNNKAKELDSNYYMQPEPKTGEK